jgi:hypothetical protein
MQSSVISFFASPWPGGATDDCGGGMNRGGEDGGATDFGANAAIRALDPVDLEIDLRSGATNALDVERDPRPCAVHPPAFVVYPLDFVVYPLDFAPDPL